MSSEEEVQVSDDDELIFPELRRVSRAPCGCSVITVELCNVGGQIEETLKATAYCEEHQDEETT